ncbi:hypothetical protein D9758_018863 [Tetrapyrgos nigripes]|uniref:DUF6699 domain-containing protein n=1 Tax=Tetrapyrgos nigripes TaxID=182062 RepID=A0A8H5BT06_9AGAR|nr:hypothetical protein D9758_018863 [Tetrapyrgos nigripes]
MSVTWSVHENPKARMSTPGSWTWDAYKTQDEAPIHPCSSIPLPGQVGHDVDVIPLLKSGSGLDIDLRMSPVVLCGRNDGWEKYLLRPATIPPLPSMSIVHPALPWAVTVHRSAYEFVTVKDVMVTVLGVLATPVEQMMPGGPVWQEKERKEKSTDRTTRLDYLPGTKLIGLRKSRRGEDIWVMEVV